MAAVSAILAAVSARVLTIAAPHRPVESEAPYDELRASGRSPRHAEFALGIGSSVPVDPVGRQAVANGCPTRHALRVGTWWQLAAKDRGTGYLLGVDHGERIRQVLAPSGAWSNGAHLVWRSTSRDGGVSGWLFLDLMFDLFNTDPLA